MLRGNWGFFCRGSGILLVLPRGLGSFGGWLEGKGILLMLMRWLFMWSVWFILMLPKLYKPISRLKILLFKRRLLIKKLFWKMLILLSRSSLDKIFGSKLNGKSKDTLSCTMIWQVNLKLKKLPIFSLNSS